MQLFQLEEEMRGKYFSDEINQEFLRRNDFPIIFSRHVARGFSVSASPSPLTLVWLTLRCRANIKTDLVSHELLFTHLWFIRPHAYWFWCGQHPLRGQVGDGWALEIEAFLGTVKWHRADRLFYVQEPTGDFKGYIITINVPVVYVARDVLILMRATSITRAIGRVGPENRDFFGPWNGNERSECNLGLQFGADSKRETSSTVSPITSSAMMLNHIN